MIEKLESKLQNLQVNGEISNKVDTMGLKHNNLQDRIDLMPTVLMAKIELIQQDIIRLAEIICSMFTQLLKLKCWNTKLTLLNLLKHVPCLRIMTG